MKKKHWKRMAKVLDCKVKDIKLGKRKSADFRGVPDLSVINRLHPAIGERSLWSDIFDELPTADLNIQRAAYELVMGHPEIDDNEAELIWSAMRTWNRRD
jgi:hypothetical protein